METRELKQLHDERVKRKRIAEGLADPSPAAAAAVAHVLPPSGTASQPIEVNDSDDEVVVLEDDDDDGTDTSRKHNTTQTRKRKPQGYNPSSIHRKLQHSDSIGTASLDEDLKDLEREENGSYGPSHEPKRIEDGKEHAKDDDEGRGGGV